jgi:twitching motility two-component system response regulator PilH
MKKILVVENSPTIISVADSLLRQRGYDVTCLSDGWKALEYTRDEKPDLILTAISLEGINGIELSKKIIADPVIGGIPIILLIGEKDSGYLDQADLSGARGRLKKPFSPKELLQVVEKYTGSSVSGSDVKIVDQSAEGQPKLKGSVSPREIGTSMQTSPAGDETNPETKHETVVNIKWEDISNDQADETVPSKEDELNDAGLIIDDDQYGLTKSPEELASDRAGQDEDYDWFIGEMKKDIEEPKTASERAPKPQPKTEARVAYTDIGSPVGSKDESKYREFLNQFRQDADVLTTDQSSTDDQIDLNRLTDRIADKLAQKIVEKLDKQELKRIIGSMLNENR